MKDVELQDVTIDMEKENGKGKKNDVSMHEENVSYDQNRSQSAQKIREFSAKKVPVDIAPSTP